MTNLSFEFNAKKDMLEDMPMPTHLHGKIMKRVFIANYGKYLLATTAVLFVNLGVLAIELYRRVMEINVSQVARSLSESFSFSPAYLSTAFDTLYSTLPIQSMVATSLTAALCAYMSYVFVKFHRDPQSVGIFRSMLP